MVQLTRQSVMLLVVFPIFFALATAAVVGRFWGRYIKRVKPTISDYSIVAAWALSGALAGTNLSTIFLGAEGRQITTATPDELVYFSKNIFWGVIFWASANTAVKISVLTMYIELFWTNAFRCWAYGTMVVTFGLWLFIVIGALVNCRPIAFNWDKTIPGGRCGETYPSWLAQAILNLLIDIVIVFLPVPVLWSLQMRLTKKIGIYFMFSIGIVICIITGLRIHELIHLDVSNITYSAIRFGLYNHLEVFLGIFNACLPICRPVFHENFQRLVSRWSQSERSEELHVLTWSRLHGAKKSPEKTAIESSATDSLRKYESDQHILPKLTPPTHHKTSVNSELGSEDISAPSGSLPPGITVTKAWGIDTAQLGSAKSDIPHTQ